MVCLSCILFLLCISTYGQMQISFKPIFNKDSISVLKFYVSNVQILYRDGTKFKENNSFRLLDIEYIESFLIILNAPSKAIEKISFDVGIDSTTSVSGALDGDLDPIKGMYWAWHSGYINLKLEGKSKACSTISNEFHFHVGGYRSPFYALRRIDVPIVNQMGSSVAIQMNIALLLDKINLKQINNIMLPGKEAMQIADYLPQIFSNK